MTRARSSSAIAFAILGILAFSLSLITAIDRDAIRWFDWLWSYGWTPAAGTGIVFLFLSLIVYGVPAHSRARELVTRSAWSLVAASLALILLTPAMCAVATHAPPPNIWCWTQIGLTLTPDRINAPWFVLYSWGLPVLVGIIVSIGLTVLGARRTARSDPRAGSGR